MALDHTLIVTTACSSIFFLSWGLVVALLWSFYPTRGILQYLTQCFFLFNSTFGTKASTHPFYHLLLELRAMQRFNQSWKEGLEIEIPDWRTAVKWKENKKIFLCCTETREDRKLWFPLPWEVFFVIEDWWRPTIVDTKFQDICIVGWNA